MMSFVELQETAVEASQGTSIAGGLIGAGIAYVFFAVCWMMIAKKTQHADLAWWAWVPVLNVLLVFKIANKPTWWIFLMLVPIVNFFAWLFACLSAAQVRGKGAFTGILASIIPVVGLPMMAIGD
jgi:hypothetical protein